MKLFLILLKLKFRILSIINPDIAAVKALELFQKPAKNKIRPREENFLNSTKVTKIPYPGEDIMLYDTGPTLGKKVLLIHGWDSNPGSLANIAEVLVKNGYHVLAYNVPAHGKSTLEKTNMLDVSEILGEVLNLYSSDGKLSVITHSFGSGAVSFALKQSQVTIDKLIMVTSPDKLYDIFKNFSDYIGLSEKAFASMLKITENRFNEKFENLQISKALQSAKYSKALLIHDYNDKVLPFSNTSNIHATNKNTELYVTENKGHYRILWDKQVLDKIIDFLK